MAVAARTATATAVPESSSSSSSRIPGQDGIDGSLTTTFVPDASCFERHYLQPVADDDDDDDDDGDGGGGDVTVTFMAYDAYHPELTDLVPTCGPRASSAGCYPPGDWDAPVFSPGLYCPRGWTTASISLPHATWCCPSGLEFDHDTTRPWCSFPMRESSSRVVMTVDCTPTTFAVGAGQTTSLTLAAAGYYGGDRSPPPPYVVAASRVVLVDGGAVGIRLVGDGANATDTDTDTAPTTSGTSSSSSSSSLDGPKIGAVAGAAAAGLLLAAALGLVFFRRRYRGGGGGGGRRRRRRRFLRGSGGKGEKSELDATPAATPAMAVAVAVAVAEAEAVAVAELGSTPLVELPEMKDAVVVEPGNGLLPPVTREAPSVHVHEME